MKCDELKSFEVGLGQMLEGGLPVVIAVYENNTPRLLEEKKVYLKSEADKVIAKLKEKQRWRKFPDEKPKWGEEVLVVDDESKHHIVRFSHDLKWISWGKMNTCESNCVKYWMPMPLAPKEAL